jgi:single-strand DNA-binding protein
MSNGINSVTIIGRAGQDCEMRVMPNGNSVATLSLATSESWKDKQSGERQESTEWHRCAAFGKLAEICGQYIKKGSMIYICGKLKTRKYEKDGQTHYSTEIIFNEMQMLDSRDKTGTAQPANNQGQHQQDDNFQDKDIPF